MEFSGFDWDDGNRAKCRKHGVSSHSHSRPHIVKRRAGKGNQLFGQPLLTATWVPFPRIA